MTDKHYSSHSSDLSTQMFPGLVEAREQLWTRYLCVRVSENATKLP